MVLTTEARANEPEQRLLRRLQLTQGLHWLLAAQGDPFAALLRGFDDDLTAIHGHLRAAGPLWRSRTGAWVIAHHDVAEEALGEPGLTPLSPVDRLVDPAGSPVTGQRDLTARPVPGDVRTAILDALPDRFDVVAVARAAAVAALTAVVTEGPERSPATWADAEPALDAMVCPQPPRIARRSPAAVAELSVGTRSPLTAVAGVRVAAALSASAVAALLTADLWPGPAARPGEVSRQVTETLRVEPPVALCLMAATRPVRLAGRLVCEGETVAVVLSAANRDPRMLSDPDRFDPDRAPAGSSTGVLVPGGPYEPLMAFARAQAEELLTGLAERFPRLRADGPAVRLRRAPVTRALARLPVRAA